MIKTVALSRREQEVLNTLLSAEIMKQQFHYGHDTPLTDVLYSLRDKLVDKKELTQSGTTSDTK